jgi:hypothetical protein
MIARAGQTAVIAHWFAAMVAEYHVQMGALAGCFFIHRSGGKRKSALFIRDALSVASQTGLHQCWYG